MQIQRPSEREPRPSALDVFTDREELIAAFERNLEHKKPDQHRVLVFYGDGGIGKTTLLQKLEQHHRQRCTQALMGRIDLAGADTTPPDLLLYRLRRLFPAIPFPSFSLALAEYCRRFHPEQVYGNNRKELLHGAGPYADALAGGLEVLANLSGVGAAVNAMKAAATAQRQLSDWVQRGAEPWLQRSQSLSEEQMLAQLPLQWARDFRQAISAQIEPNWDDAITYNGSPPLIAFDTYETLWHSGMGKTGRRREPRERWLVDLVSELPEVLWVIAGRDRLSWEEAYDPAWSEACEQHLVGRLSDDDARSFLAKRGIEEPLIVEKILCQAAGVPFYLELETQLHDRYSAEERTPEMFGRSQEQQIERLLSHLDTSERATLMLMAAFGIWDQRLFRKAVAHFATGYPATGAAELGRLWSIEPIGEGRWQLHNEMTHHLQAYERRHNYQQYVDVHRWGFDYYDNLLKQINQKSDKTDAADWLQCGFSHACIITPATEWAIWLDDRLEQIGAGKISQALIDIVNIAIHHIELDLGSSSKEMSLLLQRRGRLHRALASYSEAEQDFRQSLIILSSACGADLLQRIQAINALAGLMRLLNRYKESHDLYHESLLLQRKSGASSSWQYAKTLNDFALLLANERNFSEAEKYYQDCLKLKEEIRGPNDASVGITLNNLAAMLRDNDRHQEALELFERALTIKQSVYGEGHIRTSNTLNCLGNLYRKIGNYKDAEACLKKSLSIRISTYGPDHPLVARSESSLAKLFYLTSRESDAESLFRHSLTIKEAYFGSDHVSTMNTLEDLASTLLTRNADREAILLFEKYLAISLQKYGGTDERNIAGIERIAKTLLASGKNFEARLLCGQRINRLKTEAAGDVELLERLEKVLRIF